MEHINMPRWTYLNDSEITRLVSSSNELTHVDEPKKSLH